MKILQLCKKVPWPLTDGESIAVNALSEVFAQEGHHVDLLCMNTSKHHRDISLTRSNLHHYRNIYSCTVDNRFKILRAIGNLFSKDSIHVSRLKSKDFRRLLVEVVQSEVYDIIQIETIYPTIYLDEIKKHSEAKIVIRCHNAEHRIWKRLAKRSAFLRKWYFRMQSRRIQEFEIAQINKCDVYLPISQNDASTFKNLDVKTESKVVPIGLNSRKYEIDLKRNIPEEEFHLCFIGTLDWRPNSDGLFWFLKNVWPPVSDKFRDKVKLHIAGRNAPPIFYDFDDKNVIMHGEISDALKFIASYDALLIPLFAGSGQRVKILEGLALNKYIITTSIGVEGIFAGENEGILEANNVEEFIHHIGSLIARRKNLKTSNGFHFIRTNHNQYTIGESLIKTYYSLLKKK